MAGQPKKDCFVISPIGDSDSPTRKRSDQVLKHIIRPVVEQFGYTTERADRISETGVITSHILQRLLDAELVVADMTDNNANVFYELAIRHATGKAVIHLIQEDDQIPFDVASIRAISYALSDPDKLEACKDTFRRTLNSVQANGATETPVSQALNLKRLQQSNQPVETALANISLMLEELSRERATDNVALRTEINAIRNSDALNQPRISTFSGSGSGLYGHGLGVTPDVILLQALGPGSVTYDSLTSTSVHITTEEGTAFAGVAIKSTPRFRRAAASSTQRRLHELSELDDSDLLREDDTNSRGPSGHRLGTVHGVTMHPISSFFPTSDSESESGSDDNSKRRLRRPPERG